MLHLAVWAASVVAIAADKCGDVHIHHETCVVDPACLWNDALFHCYNINEGVRSCVNTCTIL